MISRPHKVKFQLIYWKDVPLEPGVAFTIQGTYEYEPGDVHAEKIIKVLKKQKFTYELIEVQEILLETNLT